MDKDEVINLLMENAKKCLTDFKAVSNNTTNAINAIHALGGFYALAETIWDLGSYNKYAELGGDTEHLRKELLQISTEGTMLWENQKMYNNI